VNLLVSRCGFNTHSTCPVVGSCEDSDVSLILFSKWLRSSPAVLPHQKKFGASTAPATSPKLGFRCARSRFVFIFSNFRFYWFSRCKCVLNGKPFDLYSKYLKIHLSISVAFLGLSWRPHSTCCVALDVAVGLWLYCFIL